MVILQANITHLEDLALLFDGYRVFYEQVSDVEKAKAFLQKRLEQQDSIIFIAFNESEEAIGFTQLYPTFSSVSMQVFYILNDLYVLPTQRGRGVGKALLEKAKQKAKEEGWKGLALETATDNPAQKLYEKLGWQRSTDFYHYFWANIAQETAV